MNTYIHNELIKGSLLSISLYDKKKTTIQTLGRKLAEMHNKKTFISLSAFNPVFGAERT